jgi:hypothetical protein
MNYFTKGWESKMTRYDVVQAEDGSWVDFTEAQEDVLFLVNLIREAQIRGTDDEYEVFDEICENWGV